MAHFKYRISVARQWLIATVIATAIMATNLYMPSQAFALDKEEDFGPKRPLVLKELLKAADRKNPGIKSARERSLAMNERVSPAGALPDPMLMLGFKNLPVDSFALDKDPMTGIMIGAKQKFPFPGKRPLMKKIASWEARAAEKNIRNVRNKVAMQVKTAYFSLTYRHKAIDITKENQEILRGFIRIAETKYSVGAGLQQDVLKAQVELSILADKLLRLEKQLTDTRVKINALLNRAPSSPLGRPEGLPRYKKLPYSDEDLEKMAKENNPILKAIEDMIRSSNAGVRYARRNYYPDFSLSLGYMFREGVERMPTSDTDLVTLNLDVSLPVFLRKKQAPRLREASAKLESLKSAFTGTVDTLFRKIGEEYARLSRDEAQMILFDEGIIPQASQSLKSASVGYQVNKVDFLTLLDNQIKLFNFELELERVKSDREIAIASLEYLVGEDLKKEAIINLLEDGEDK